MSDPSKTASDIAQSVSELPFWLIVVLAMASGLSGEMLRASALVNLTWQEIAGRILLRFGAASLVGLGIFMLATSFGYHVYTAAAMCIFAAVLGGDVASSLIERFASKKIDQVKP